MDSTDVTRGLKLRTKTAAFGRRMALGCVIAGGVAAAPAGAETFQLPGSAFVQQCPCTTGIGQANVNAGVLTPDGPSTFYAALPFSGVGEVCSLRMFYRDVNDLEGMTVTLFKKNVAVGDAIDRSPSAMAKVKSKPGVVETVRQNATTNIKSRKIDSATQFHYVQVDFVNINMDLVGVHVQVETTCPQ